MLALILFLQIPSPIPEPIVEGPLLPAFPERVSMLDYTAAHAQALKSGKPMVIGVGCAAPSGKWITTYAAGLDGYKTPCVVLSVPQGDSMIWLRTFPASVRQADIDVALESHRARLGVSREALPFAGDVPQAADDDGWAMVDGLKMRKYAKTQYSQRLAVTNNRESNSLYHVSRDDIWTNSPTVLNPNRIFPWAVSGGLHASAGWRSTGAVYLPPGRTVQVTTRRVPVPASHPLQRIHWTFPVGTVFADILSTDRGLFEVRKREKIGEKWASKVVDSIAENRPVGYNGKVKACAECHDRAGESLQYGIVLRGDDGNFSWSPFVEGTFELSRDWPLENEK